MDGWREVGAAFLFTPHKNDQNIKPSTQVFRMSSVLGEDTEVFLRLER